ncbi:U3-containing 90S pre-ribosomal complex subunit-domain containing protein [Peziza echinospora]|nr:U3-containing 90S pre-ribosomal complex subunit-domain containing protein [Peziza echinospora]
MAIDEDDFDDAPVLAPPSPSSGAVAAIEAVTQSKSKRKREAEKLKKHKKRRELGDEGEDDESHLIIDPTGRSGINTAIGKLDPSLIADFVGQKIRHFEKELSSIEMEDRYLPASVFVDSTGWPKARNLENYPDFLEAYSKVKGRGASLKKPREKNACPHTFVVTAAALRAADVNRALKKFQSKESHVAKLFAKHIKLKESIEFCQQTKIGMGVGTPGRILDLIKEDALSLDEVVRIVIDASHIDQKKRTIFEIKETQKGIMDLLSHEPLKKRILNGSTVIIFY